MKVERFVLPYLLLIAFVPSPSGAAEGEPFTVSVGGLFYAQYSYELTGPADINAFDITRAYINVRAGLQENIKARLTPDIVRETTQSSVQGSLLFRLKYAYLEIDNFLLTLPSAGDRSWIKFGLHETPWLDFEETINRYRVQGTMFAEREGYIPGSADFGLGYVQFLPGDYGEINASFVNGEGFRKSETNKFKNGQIRATVRPFPREKTLRGLRLSGFADYGYYAQDQPKQLIMGMISFEHPFVVFTGQILEALERKGPASVPVDGRGYSLFSEIKCPLGLAAMARLDYLDPDMSRPQDGHTRQIYGLAYWKEMRTRVVGVLLDDEQVTYEPGAGKPYEQRLFFQIHIAFEQ